MSTLEELNAGEIIMKEEIFPKEKQFYLSEFLLQETYNGIQRQRKDEASSVITGRKK